MRGKWVLLCAVGAMAVLGACSGGTSSSGRPDTWPALDGKQIQGKWEAAPGEPAGPFAWMMFENGECWAGAANEPAFSREMPYSYTIDGNIVRAESKNTFFVNQIADANSGNVLYSYQTEIPRTRFVSLRVQGDTLYYSFATRGCVVRDIAMRLELAKVAHEHTTGEEQEAFGKQVEKYENASADAVLEARLHSQDGGEKQAVYTLVRAAGE